jgi:hypothetical protein
VDELISEESGPAHKFPDEAKQALANALDKWLPHLNQIPNKDVFEKRINRWKKLVIGMKLLQKKFQALHQLYPEYQHQGKVVSLNAIRIVEMQWEKEFLIPSITNLYWKMILFVRTACVDTHVFLRGIISIMP